MTIDHLGAHTKGGTVTTGQDAKEDTSNDLDNLLSSSQNKPTTFDVSAGGTLHLDTPDANLDQYLESGFIQFFGSPAGPVTVILPDGATGKRIAFENISGQTVTIDTVTGATPTRPILDGVAKIFQVRGIEISILADNSAATGALLADGSVNPTGDFDWAGFVLTRVELKDYAEARDAPAAAATIELDYENGPGFEVTLDQDTTFTFSNWPASGKMGSFTLWVHQNGTGGWIITWPTEVDWHEQSTPTPTTEPNDTSIFSFASTDAGARVYGFVGGIDFG